MMKRPKSAALILPLLLAIASLRIAPAQKLPKVQNGSVRAPANIKIDGKLTEWNDRLKAYNWGNFIHYTLSNNDEYLYIAIRLDDLGVKKFLMGGLTFTISSELKRGEKLAVTFPVKKPVVETDNLFRLNSVIDTYNTLKQDTIGNRKGIDSLVAVSNDMIRQGHDLIYVKGIPATDDPVISVYNTEGIKAGASVDSKMGYIYELAIPLKYLDPAIIKGKSFGYDIRLNGGMNGKVFNSAPSSKPSVSAVRYNGPGAANMQFLFDATGFAGIYTLALKQ